MFYHITSAALPSSLPLLTTFPVPSPLSILDPSLSCNTRFKLDSFFCYCLGFCNIFSPFSLVPLCFTYTRAQKTEATLSELQSFEGQEEMTRIPLCRSWCLCQPHTACSSSSLCPSAGHHPLPPLSPSPLPSSFNTSGTTTPAPPRAAHSNV